MRLVLAVLLGLLAGCSPYGDSEFFFDSAGVTISYYDFGEGEPLLLLHGFGMSARTQWAMLADDLAQSYRVIIPDHRGHGGSDKPVGEQHYGRPMVEDLIGLLDHLGLERVRVAGMSMGGYMAIAAVADYPQRFNCAFIGASGWSEPAVFQGNFSEEVAQAFERGEGWELASARLNPGKEPGSGSWLGRFFFWLLTASHDPDVMASVFRGMRGFQVEAAALSPARRQMLTVIGDQDGLLPMARELDALSPDYELQVVPGHDHGSIGTSPEFLAAMQSFLADDEKCASGPTNNNHQVTQQ
jgi:3-oxoadipate enol-lactonase